MNLTRKEALEIIHKSSVSKQRNLYKNKVLFAACIIINLIDLISISPNKKIMTHSIDLLLNFPLNSFALITQIITLLLLARFIYKLIVLNHKQSKFLSNYNFNSDYLKLLHNKKLFFFKNDLVKLKKDNSGKISVIIEVDHISKKVLLDDYVYVNFKDLVLITK